MPWVLMTPFGNPVEPEVNRNFAIVSAPTDFTARSSAAPGCVAVKVSNAVTPSRLAPLRLATTVRPLRSSAASAAANGPVSAT